MIPWLPVIEDTHGVPFNQVTIIARSASTTGCDDLIRFDPFDDGSGQLPNGAAPAPVSPFHATEVSDA